MAGKPSSSTSAQKRQASDKDGSISPPPLKRKAQAAISSMLLPFNVQQLRGVG